MYDTILVPTDGSEGAAEVIDRAIELASLADATVHALYVVDTRDAPTLPDGKWVAIEEALENEGQQAVTDVADRATDAGVNAVTVVEQGTPHERILEYADEIDADLVVMGTKGQTGLDKVLLGSVTEKVVRHTDRSVLVERLGDQGRGE